MKLKLIRNVVIGVVLLLVLAVVLGIVFINAIARKAIESQASASLGVPTTLSSASIGLFSGKFGLRQLSIANPPGFADATLLSLGSADLDFPLSGIFSSPVTVPSLRLDGLALNLQRKPDSSNYGIIIDNLKKGSSPSAQQPAAEGKKFIINELVLTNITVKLDMAGLPNLPVVGDAANNAGKFNVTLPEIRLANVGKTGSGVGGSGVTAGQLTEIIFQALLSAVVDKGGLDPAILGDIQGSLAQMPDRIKGMAAGLADGAAKTAADAAKSIADPSKVIDEAKKAGEGLRNLLPGSGK